MAGRQAGRQVSGQAGRQADRQVDRHILPSSISEKSSLRLESRIPTA